MERNLITHYTTLNVIKYRIPATYLTCSECDGLRTNKIKPDSSDFLLCAYRCTAFMWATTWGVSCWAFLRDHPDTHYMKSNAATDGVEVSGRQDNHISTFAKTVCSSSTKKILSSSSSKTRCLDLWVEWARAGTSFISPPSQQLCSCSESCCGCGKGREQTSPVTLMAFGNMGEWVMRESTFLIK